MRTINFNEMALLNGGQAVSVAAPTTNLTLDGAWTNWRHDVACMSSAVLFVATCANPVGWIAAAVVAASGGMVVATCW